MLQYERRVPNILPGSPPPAPAGITETPRSGQLHTWCSMTVPEASELWAAPIILPPL